MSLCCSGPSATPPVAVPVVNPALAQNHILVGNALGVAADVAMSGDATINATGAITLAPVITPGTYGDASHVAQVTVDAKGRITAAANVAIPGGGGNMTTLSCSSISTATVSCAATGNIFTPQANISVIGLGLVLTTVPTGVYQFGIAPYNRATNKITGPPVYTPTYTETSGITAVRAPFVKFAAPVVLTAGVDYVMFFVRIDNTASVSTTVNYANVHQQGPGMYLAATAGVAGYQIASLAPTTADTWTTAGGGVWAFQMVYSF